MADGPDRVAAVVRHRGALLASREGPAGKNATLPTAAVVDGDDEGALRTLLEGLGLPGAAIEHRGEPLRVDDGVVVPFLVAADDDAVADDAASWVRPSALAGTASRVYEAVAPTVDRIARDRDRGSTALAIDALWALRDAAHAADGLRGVREAARRLLEARPGMAALATRVDRAMAGADSPADVAAAATAGIERAADADAAAASLVGDVVDGRVLTLSRSGTVRAALLDAALDVVVLASRPGGEGLAVADELADAGLTVESCADADVYGRLRADDVDAVLVGADSVTPAGGVVNKVGTWAAAHAASLADVPCYVVCAADKVLPRGVEPSIEPLFDRTPPGFVTAVLTDRGRLEPDDVAGIAEEHRQLSAWRDEPPGVS